MPVTRPTDGECITFAHGSVTTQLATDDERHTPLSICLLRVPGWSPHDHHQDAANLPTLQDRISWSKRDWFCHRCDDTTSGVTFGHVTMETRRMGDVLPLSSRALSDRCQHSRLSAAW